MESLTCDWIVIGMIGAIILFILYRKFAGKKQQGVKPKPREGAKISLGDVQETALIPLAIKANESSRKQPRVYDEKALQIIADLGVDTESYDKFFSHEGVVARTLLFDEATRELLEKHPDATVVNIGCGFDDRFTRTDNGKSHWYHVDMPDLIEVRRRVFGSHERQTCIAGNLVTDDWTKDIPNDRETIIIAEGLVMYFTEEQVKALMAQIKSYFHHGYLLVELMPTIATGNERMHDTVKSTKAHFTFGINDGKEMEKFCDGFSLLRESSFFEAMKRYSWIGWIGDKLFRRIMNRLAIYEFK